jgi:hypothetical protein
MSDGHDVMNPNGLTDEQAKEIHSQFMTGMWIWVVAAAIAHLLTWRWMPWFP